MPSITLEAHYNGSEIVLDEPFDLEPNTKLLVTVLPDETDSERRSWFVFSAESLSRAYGDDEPEYTLQDLKELNPEYKGR